MLYDYWRTMVQMQYRGANINFLQSIINLNARSAALNSSNARASGSADVQNQTVSATVEGADDARYTQESSPMPRHFLALAALKKSLVIIHAYQLILYLSRAHQSIPIKKVPIIIFSANVNALSDLLAQSFPRQAEGEASRRNDIDHPEDDLNQADSPKSDNQR